MLYGRSGHYHISITRTITTWKQRSRTLTTEPDFSPPIPNGNGTYQNFGHDGPGFRPPSPALTPDGDGNKDADFDLRLKIDLDKLEPDFYTTGWGDRTSRSDRFLVSNSMMPILEQKLNYARNEAYMGLEAIMVGKAWDL